jgi:hypothetical protein
MWWVAAGLVGWCASAPVVAVSTGRLLARRVAGVAVEDLVHVPDAWTADQLDVAGA